MIKQYWLEFISIRTSESGATSTWLLSWVGGQEEILTSSNSNDILNALSYARVFLLNHKERIIGIVPDVERPAGRFTIFTEPIAERVQAPASEPNKTKLPVTNQSFPDGRTDHLWKVPGHTK